MLKKILVGLLGVLWASNAAAEWPQAQKDQIANKLVNSLERGKIAMQNLSTDARFEIGRSIPQNVAAHQKIADAWAHSFDALVWLLDMDKLPVSRAQIQIDAFGRIASSIARYQQAVPLLQAVRDLCTVNCGTITNAQTNLNLAISQLQTFNLTLDYTGDPRVPDVINFPGVTRTSAPLVGPHGDWDTFGMAGASWGRNAILTTKARMAALLDHEALATFEVYVEHSSAEAAWIAAKALPLTAGIEYGALGGVNGHVSKIFAGMTTTRTRHFARFMLFVEMMYATGWDDSQLDVNGRLPHRGVAYLWTQECINTVKAAKSLALPAAAQDLMDTLTNACSGWKDSDSTGFNSLVFRDFNAGGPPPIDCANVCPGASCPGGQSCQPPVDGSLFCAPGTTWDGALCQAVPPPPCPVYELNFVPTDQTSGVVRCEAVP